MMGIQTENNGTKEKVCQYVYLSMFNDVNVCKCLMSHMQIEANVHGVFLRVCMLWFVSTAQLEPGSRSDLSSFGTYKTPHVFQAKDTLRYIYYDYTMYMAIAPLNDLRPGQILLFVPLAANPRSPHTAPSASHWQTHL